MSASSEEPPHPAFPLLSNTMDDLLIPGVVVELDAGEAELFGAFQETALTEEEAWAANADLDGEEAGDGA